MARVRCTDLQARPTAFLDRPSRTLDELQPLVAPFETACQAPRAAGRRDGPPRTARRLPVSQHWPLPPPAERLLLSLVSGKTSALHVVQGQLFRMRQSKATPWMPVLLPVLLAPRRPLGDAPARSLTALAQRRGGRRGHRGHPLGGGADAPGRRARRRAGVPPCAHDGTARRIVCPQDPAAQTACESGKQQAPTGKHVLLVNALLTILCLSAPSAGRVHDKRLAVATPSPFPAGRRW